MPFNADLSQKIADVIKHPITESLRRVNESIRLLGEFRELSKKNSISNPFQSLLMSLMTSSFLQSKDSKPAKVTKIPTAFGFAAISRLITDRRERLHRYRITIER